ncbi:hypothetical protein A3A14_02975 [Candidatus Daviesbacteria bacterium RIFCSPLOWO2_01_FULL_43_38]|uniref:Uncharacterized protein n=1 Tax=Candidatus Daviesbacteria bacterium RIFCSPHIGHO2_12_FULL_43_11 TaxID=1797780 RepID=A0A1F5K2P4_9BACT|nr:MAG: hypothetical protein A2874_03560 [Candidatus Daviesbacteria bacterium RIFCSPHIGHO2_01_FULL_43_17]OGE35247.1 MAG: hypothetical protein A3E45_03695 [Candidatus Daviesbacteria bacterium RIFCSPHIGHO2_12_FULL_43_11]OGE63592.1 MAG: hypothetical protein A3A14_02975 [Candidatus Daviesbacteria bacterium RIFCSPLOWO2_01_FULL_43_38]OGE69211.1 MAG: hypothetical protein A3J21_01660 [Candidatus Daviesbacteria bacterium RIFCSPLOWO2_02_FULL_43_11]
MTETQNFIPIEDIQDGLVYLKDGSVTLVLSTSAVNFGLLFETEQMGIIDSFARLLNSLSFPIQIVIHSKRLDVSTYLHTLDQAINAQPNPLLKNMSLNFRKFVESIIKEKNVLDKQFYVCINVTAPELGVLPRNIADKSKKATTILSPRRDHLVSQLLRLGLKARQLPTVELVKLFYEIYNPPENGVQVMELTNLAPVTQIIPAPKPAVTLTRLVINPQTKPNPDIYQPPAPKPQPSTPPPGPLSVSHLSPPFVVEELAE